MNVGPMDYSRPYILRHGDKIDVGDLTTFVAYMKSDTLIGLSTDIRYCLDVGGWR